MTQQELEKERERVRGYKAFDSDLKCRGFQYEVGKTYEHEYSPSICDTGFHFCEKAESVYGYYDRSANTRICEVEALGEIVTNGDKSCTNKIKIIREIEGKELINLILKGNNSGDYNSGYYNSGHRNSGNYNSGHRNSGHRNSGNYNSSYYNSGHRNSGHCNSGDYNSGDYNSGQRNSGDYNSGHCNSGYYNSGHRNSGYFNSNTPYVRLFNKGTKLRWDSEEIKKLNYILSKVRPILQWVYESSMTDEEKVNFPSYKTTGGFLKNTGRNDWSSVTQEDFEFIKSLPNFDAKVFKDCTGVEIDNV